MIKKFITEIVNKTLLKLYWRQFVTRVQELNLSITYIEKVINVMHSRFQIQKSCFQDFQNAKWTFFALTYTNVKVNLGLDKLVRAHICEVTYQSPMSLILWFRKIIVNCFIPYEHVSYIWSCSTDHTDTCRTYNMLEPTDNSLIWLTIWHMIGTYL